MRQGLSFLSIVLGIIILGGCSYDGGGLDNPITRRLEWFSFVGGDDIRSSCKVSSPDRYRFIYTALYEQQVRVYDVDSQSRLLKEEVFHPANLSRFNLGDIGGLWDSIKAKTPLTTVEYDAFDQSLVASGIYAPPPVGLNLPSHSYNWTVAFCYQGRYGFTGWLYNENSPQSLPFAQWLFAHDKTGEDVIPPTPFDFDPVYAEQQKSGHVVEFIITVGKDGPVR